MHDVINNFIQNSLLDYETVDPWHYTFRGSSLPTCPVQLMLGKFYKHRNLEKAVSFSTRYAYHIGRAIHSLVQESWSRQSYLWGDWICSDSKYCGVKYNNTCLEKGQCIRCGSPATYIEKYVVDEKTGFSGHCDAPVFVPELDGYVIFELKTRNSNIISKAVQPYMSDLYQVSMYATLLSRIHYLRIVGRAVLWLGKPRPKPYKFWFYEGIGEDLAEEQFKLKTDLDQKLKNGCISEIVGICNTHEDAEYRNCPFSGICLSPSRDRLLKEEYQEWIQRS